MTLPGKSPGFHIEHDKLMLPVRMNCMLRVPDGEFEYNRAPLYNYLTPSHVFFTITLESALCE